MRKVVIISGLVIGAGITGYVIYLAIMRHKIRERLDELLKKPESGIGGIEKLIAAGAFDPTRYQKSGKATITLTQARERAKTIWDNYSAWLGSNQETIVSALSGLGHYDDVSKITHEFNESYGEELPEVLLSAIKDKAQLSLLASKIEKLTKK